MSAGAGSSRPGGKGRRARSFRRRQRTGPPTVWRGTVVAVAPGDDRRPRHRLLTARTRATGEIKYCSARGRRRVHVRPLRRVAGARRNVDHVFRVGKSAVGLTPFEARSYVSLKRHLALGLVVLAFGALHSLRLRGENPGLTLEQLGRALKFVCRRYLSRRPGTSESGCLLDIINSHQERDATARRSRQKRPRRLGRFAAL